MKYKQIDEKLNLSSFSLGTVQLGMTYGLGEDKDVPSEEKAFSVLDKAMELGVNNLDTANNYGTSETVIGRWLSQRKAKGLATPWIVTKIGQFNRGSYSLLRDDVLHQTEACLETLGMDSLDCLMLHDYDDYAQDKESMYRIFEELKSSGMIKYSGISAYSRHDYGVLADSEFDCVQIPLNVFDWGQIENGGMQKLKDSGITVFVRSVFLQGLVFHTPADLDPRMDFCFPYLEKYHKLCKEFELSPAVLALSFVLSVPGVATTVLGCDNARQLEANCKLFDQTVHLNDEQWNKLRDAFYNIDPRVINPGVWYNHT